jgi:hypothetical protein
VRVSQQVWRTAAVEHRHRIRQLLEPGMISQDDDEQKSSRHRHSRPKPMISATEAADKHSLTRREDTDRDSEDEDFFNALDPKHPVYNFLVEYYGIKGPKGPRRLARWSPSPGLLVQQETTQIQTLEELEKAAAACTRPLSDLDAIHFSGSIGQAVEHGVLLEGASPDDFADLLPLRAATVLDDGQGVLYSPSLFFGMNDPTRQEDNARLATPFLWYQSILQQTLSAEPILHCHGLHEWAMQYQPPGAPAPPSAKYQGHLTLRVPREVINTAVERRGVSCTHVDALRFFAPAAGPLNHHGSSLERIDQLRLEQPACVHAHMDLLKICLKMRPFGDPVLLQRILELALEARRLDVAASPYDVFTDYGVEPIQIETKEGRAEYRTQQLSLMNRAEPIRRELLHAYSSFLPLAFNNVALGTAYRQPLAERYAKAEPGGLPWRKNLVAPSAASIRQEAEV